MKISKNIVIKYIKMGYMASKFC